MTQKCWNFILNQRIKIVYILKKAKHTTRRLILCIDGQRLNETFTISGTLIICRLQAYQNRRETHLTRG